MERRLSGGAERRPSHPQVRMMALERVERAGVTFLTDPSLRADRGIVIAFSTRTGGVSEAPYASLDLASHVGDEPAAVDENRARFLAALDVGDLRDRLTTAEQVHGLGVRAVTLDEAGAGAFAAGGRSPLAATDALVTVEPGIPLMMLFADCVPIVLVAPAARAVALVHAGWKGALGRLPGKAAISLAERAACAPSELLAYVGPHVCAEHYRVPPDRLSQFVESFGSIAAARGGLDLGAVVTKSLSEVGLPLANVVRVGTCTAERTDDFYSFRADGVTGRHAALSVILEPTR